jgi:hypothetical protein
MTLMRIISLGFVIMVWFTSCTGQQYGRQNQGTVTESKAFERAKAEFAKTGRKISDYAVSIETDSTRLEWIVWFEREGPYAKPGGKHAVAIEKATGESGVCAWE